MSRDTTAFWLLSPFRRAEGAGVQRRLTAEGEPATQCAIVQARPSSTCGETGAGRACSPVPGTLKAVSKLYLRNRVSKGEWAMNEWASVFAFGDYKI